MIKQNYTMEFLAKSGNVQQTSYDFKKSDSLEKTGFPQFKDILSGAVGKPQLKINGTDSIINSNSMQRNSKTVNDKDLDPSTKPQFRSYRELKDSKPAVEKKTENKANGAEDIRNQKETIDKEKVKTINKEAAVDSLAQILGVSSNDMTKLLQAADIKPEELCSEDTAKTVDKLAELMELDGPQKNALAELVSTLKELVKDYNSVQKYAGISDSEAKSITAESIEGNVKEAKTNENWVKVNIAEITVVDNNKLTQEFKDVMAEMKAKLNVIAENLQKNPSVFKTDIAESLKTTLLKLSENQESVVNDGFTDEMVGLKSDELSTGINEPKVNASDETKQESGKESRNDSKDSSTTYTESSNTAVKSTQTENSKLNDEAGIQFNNVIDAKVQKSNIYETQKLSKELNVPKSEIVEQVVNKAKVVLTAEKSEMVMDLKPESLGKLSLKVVTERGLVVAKFIAENQQVKEALEANMQLLKDSLEKQGLSVQGFSVSVRQDSYRGAGQNSQYGSEAKEEKSKAGIMNGINVSNEVNLEKLQKVNPYAWSDSQINLTA